jgi:hypothetical protein
MPTTNLFAYNTGTTISGTEQVGSIAIGVSPSLIYSQNAGGVRWWNGPDEDLGYVIAHTTLSGTQPNRDNVPSYIGFWRSSSKTENSLIDLTNSLFRQNFTSGSDCKTYLNTNGYWVSWVSDSFDPDAQAFITAAGITNSTEKSAINTLVLGLKTDDIWTGMTAIYPFVGGTASSHKFNLKDPRDLDVAYRLNFRGGWVHNSQGIKGNGINTYADTFYTGRLGMMGVYSPSTSGMLAYGYMQYREYCDEGCYENQEQKSYLQSGYAQFSCCNWTLASPGFYGEGLGQIGNSTGYKNGIKISDAHDGSPVIDLPLGSIRSIYYDVNGNISSNSVNGFDNSVQSFSYFSDIELTPTKSANLYIRVQAFQTALARQVATLPVSDPDAFKFLNNVGIRNPATSLTQMNSINTLVVDLKAANIWTKMRDIYPFVTDTVNLFSYSETFTNSYWNKVNITITANTTTAPNSTVTASSFIETTATNFHNLSVLSQLTLTDEQYTASIYLKKSARDWAYIGMSNSVTSNTLYGYFNISTGTIGTVDSGATATITDAGNGWYRCTLTRTMSSSLGGDNCIIGSAIEDITPFYSGNGTTAMFIWGAQIEFGATATTYQSISNTSSNRTQPQFSVSLKDPINSNNFASSGGMTFTPKGARGNGINGYIFTPRNLQSTFAAGNLHISAYSKVGVIPNRNMSLWGGSAPFAPYGTVQATFYNTPFNMTVSLCGLAHIIASI